MKTITEATAALRAATTDPHRLLSALAQTGSPALFDALLSSTRLQSLGRDDLQAPVSSRFRGPESALLLRGLIALAPPESAVASRLRSTWTGVLLSGRPALPGTVSARYLDRLTNLSAVHIEHAIGVTELSDLATHTGLALLSFSRCSLLGTDLSGLSGARITELRWIGQHPTVLEDFSLSGLSGAGITRLTLRNVWKLTALTHWPDGLEGLTLHSAPSLSLPPLPEHLKTLHMAASCAPDLGTLPESLESLTLLAVPLPDLSGMAALPRLQTLTITRGSASDLRWLPPSLTSLTLSEPIRLDSLVGIEAASGLTHLDLSRSTGLSDLTPVTALPGLTTINLRGCFSLTDLAPLRTMPSLKRILTDTTPQPTARTTPRKPATRTVVPPAYAHATRTIRELLRNNNPDATEQAVELVRSLCSPELVEILLSGVTLTEEGGWQQIAGGRRFSAHRQPAALAFIAAAEVGESAAIREAITALRVAVPVVDGTDLAALPRLSRLMLSGVKTLRSPEQLTTLERLSVLVLQRCALPEDVTIPAGVRTFEADRLPHWTDLTALSACGRLERMTISDAPALCSTRGLRSPVLAEISLGRAEVLERIVGLEDAAELVRLQVTGAMQLSDLDSLREHSSLRELSLHHVVKLSAVPTLPALRALALDGAPISVLPILPSLSTLSLQRCPSLHDLGPLGSRLTSAHLLQCDRLTSIASLAASRGLLGVHLVGCPDVRDLSPLTGLSNLRRLTVRDREAPLDLAPLADCHALAEVDLRGCTDLTGLAVLADLPGLTSLRLGRTGLRRTDLPPSLRRMARWGR